MMAVFKLLSTRSARSLQIIVLAVFAVCSLIYLAPPDLDIKRPRIQTDRVSSDGSNDVAFAPSNNSQAAALSRLRHPPPNITIIAVWNPKTNARPQAYLPNFFASIEANPKIHLLFVVFDKFQYGCDKPLSPVAENIQEICFDTEKYWRLHVDYLCQHWGCTTEDEAALLQTLLRRSDADHLNSYFRPFRAGIFAEWIDPRTPIWGWCDMDTMMGNFDRKFPWDVADQFDLIIPAPPTNYDQTLLMMSGHLMFFRHEKRVLDEFFNFPLLRSLRDFLDAPDRWVDPGAEEIEYTHFAMLNKNLTFIHFHALVWTSDHISTAGDGVYAIEHAPALHLPSSHPLPTDTSLRAYLSSIVASRRTWVSPPSFSYSGMEYNVKVYDGTHRAGLWFPTEFAVHYESDYNHETFKKLRRDCGRRFVMRRAINGPVTERLEPPQEILTFPLDDHEGTSGTYNRDNRPLLIEFLYVHYQGEKYSPWWDLPKSPLKKGEILYMNRNVGAQVWDEKGEPKWTLWADQ